MDFNEWGEIGLSFFAHAIGVWLFWYAVIWLIKLISKWGVLEKAYPAGMSSGPIAKRNFVFMRVRFINLNGIITLKASAQGLYIDPFVLFRPFKPVFVPWNDIEDIQDKKVLWQQVTECRFRKTSTVLITTTRKTGDWIREQKQKYS